MTPFVIPAAPGAVDALPAGQTLPSPDPRSLYLQQLLATMGQRPVGGAMDLQSRLLAEALDRYGQQRLAQAPAASADPIPSSLPELT